MSQLPHGLLTHADFVVMLILDQSGDAMADVSLILRVTHLLLVHAHSQPAKRHA